MSNNKSLFMIIIDYVIFVGVMLAVFHLTFNTAGKCLSDWLAAILSTLTTILDNKLINANINPAFHALVIEGICPGVGSVLAFIPTIAILFFFLLY